MRKNYLWTSLKARLNFIKSNHGTPFNWLFLPGGPGLGSESLTSLVDQLELPGTMWYLDLPGDGSNISDRDHYSLKLWSESLIEACSALENVVMVAHSTGGMFVLSVPELKTLLKGLILMNSSPDSSWQYGFINYCSQHPLPSVEIAQSIYNKHLNNENLKKLTLASMAYILTEEGMQKDFSFFEQLPYNHSACAFASQEFDRTYKALWVPDNIPTLIFAGDQDHVTPLNLFKQNREFNKPTIIMHSINNAGHYPWIENPKQVTSIIYEFCNNLTSTTASKRTTDHYD